MKFYFNLAFIALAFGDECQRLENTANEGVNLPVATWSSENGYSFSTHLNVPLGNPQISGWAVVVEFNFAVQEITQLGDLDHLWLDGETHKQLKVFKQDRAVSGTWNFNIQGLLTSEVELAPIIHWCPEGKGLTIF